MYVSSLSTDQGQYVACTQMRISGEAEEEFMVRELAQRAMDEESTYHSGTFFPWYRVTYYTYESSLIPSHLYEDICVRLSPSLRGTKEGQLIAEYIIRDAVQSARLTADCK